MNVKRVGAALGAVAVVSMAACSTTTTGVATAPDDVTPFTTSSKAPRSTAARSPRPAPGAAQLPPEAFAEVRAAGIQGSDKAIREQLMLACIMAGGSFNKTRQDVVDVLIKMGSRVSPGALRTIVDVALKYECPELAGKLGG
ncbi:MULTISPECIES: hypothetical protein [Mycolicibacterium]|jgi:hypothetical protein|uniref:DUF732 domain-containing protein n=2 Tax=Mycolicibacterium TaxID=1866885 RepID=A0A378W4T9_9MYCO|nr:MULTISPECIES: hypothetical protein [Mycolicibacterium]KLI09569.1 hypothetical protein AA982_02460 [Mycolicibacterium senegalense]KLO51791.1 hypothetical protein ABW05_09930 [Mycolicibacterium senegalense]KMV14685.1 hypothetical protein ACT17_28805 [Mycolicibacterium conceptionense]MCV7335758.1 hypothetical protein [Mycolicibacterium senegalense]MCW1819888.1 hypothetical protein [Mycolicibacterium senegalense]